MPSVRLGNPAPMMQRRIVPAGLSDELADVLGIKTISVPAPHLQQSVTAIDLVLDDPDVVELALSTNNDRVLQMIARELGTDLRRYAIAIADIEQIMATHSGGAAPTWVACEDDADLETAVAHHFACARGEPLALLTTVGRDALHAQHLTTAGQPAAANYVGVSANATAPSAASTTLPGEITTAGGGLLRVQWTYAHTLGTNTSTLTKTLTANGSDALPVVLAKIGVLNAASVGTLVYETLLNATATLTISGDNVTITETVTAG
jgi:hypothetical protein